MDAKTLEKIKDYAKLVYSQNNDFSHNLEHSERVVQNALKIVNVLDYKDAIDKNLLISTCYLHDIVVCKNKGKLLFSVYYHLFEKQLNRKYLPEIIKRFDLSKQESQILTNTIINHPYSIPYRILNKNGDLYSKILQDADSLEYVSIQRLKARYEAKGKILFYIAKLFVFIIRKNIKYFLNFPDLKLN